MTVGNLRGEVLNLASMLSGNDRDFFVRVWSTDPKIYRRRLRAVGFTGLGDVLDAGCGFGQWTIPLADLNRSVTAVDESATRVGLLSRIAGTVGAVNVDAQVASIEAMPFGDESFDAIFSYSVIYFTDYRKSITEFARLLRPGGRLYLCSNGLGWYLHNLLSGHNASPTFDPKAMAVAALENSLAYYATGEHRPGQQVIIPSALLGAALEANGFVIEGIATEGTLAAEGAEPATSFYKGDYEGAEGVYEIVARKGG